MIEYKEVQDYLFIEIAFVLKLLRLVYFKKVYTFSILEIRVSSERSMIL